ncbi:hypothetical protein EPO15_18615 [bacterium]|nr:MAG: hypothetical protein EPO15_18615 [bacterium]
MARINEVAEELRQSALAKIFNPRSLSMFLFVLVGLALAVLAPALVETNDAGYTKILQKPVVGTVTAYTNPGMFFQGFGDVYTYKASDIIYFSKHEGEGKNAADESIEVRFNDGATAKVTGNVRVDLPSSAETLVDIHKHFRSYDALIKDTVKQVVAEATILTASLMTAEESYTTKRAEFSQLAYDQLLNGVYLTEAESVTVKDAKTGEQVTKQVVRIQRDDKGIPERKESVLAKYGIKVGQFVIKDIDYEATVAGQIQSKQQALMQVVSAKANAERAIQDRLTAEEVGRKNVAVAKYEQEVKKQQAVTEAEQRLEVAKLNRASEEQNKLANIAKGEGEGEYRRKIMVADGALDKKLEAWKFAQEKWAEAFANSKNPVVPGIVMGQAGASGGNGVSQFMELLGVKAAKELQLDMSAKARE